mgnify:CR=1 FL=1
MNVYFNNKNVLPLTTIGLIGILFAWVLFSNEIRKAKENREKIREYWDMTPMPGTIHPPLVTSYCFGLVGLFTYMTGQYIVSYGMMIVCFTSVLYHSTYTCFTRWLDMCCNVIMVIYFFIFDFRRYYILCVPLLTLGWVVSYSIETSPAMGHVLCIHIPALFGMCCVAILQ